LRNRASCIVICCEHIRNIHLEQQILDVVRQDPTLNTKKIGT